MKIGIPRALYYYRFYPMWRTFFAELGQELIVSGPTTKEILDCGVKAAPDGLCLPIKVYLGHVRNLAAKGVDCLFVPHIVSVEKQEYICPKFMGLPDIVRNCLDHCPPLLSPTIDGRKGSRGIICSYLKLGSCFAPIHKVIHAYRLAAAEQRRCERSLIKEHNARQHPCTQKVGLTIAVLGHEYLLHDEFVSMGVINRLRQAECLVLTAEELMTDTIAEHNRFLRKRMYWTSGKRILGAAHYYSAKVDGIVSLMSFACGTDSMTTDLVDRHCRRSGIPHLVISLDEHTGQTGVLTRVEAFLDLLRRGRKHEDHLPPYGESVYCD